MKSIYRRLSGAYGYPESKYLPKILEMCLTEQEALIPLSLPGTPEEVAEKLRVDVSSAQSILRELFNKVFAASQIMLPVPSAIDEAIWYFILGYDDHATSIYQYSDLQKS